MLVKRLFCSYAKALNRLQRAPSASKHTSSDYNDVAPFECRSLVRNFSIDANHPPDDGQKPVTTVSLYHMKKIIKASGTVLGESVEGPTCIQTVCPVCHVVPGDAEGKPISDAIRRKIFVNKTTGNFTCSSCQYLGRWDHIEKFFPPTSRTPKTVQELRKLRDAFLELKGEHVSTVCPIPGDAIAVDTVERAREVIKFLSLEVSWQMTLLLYKHIKHVAVVLEYNSRHASERESTLERGQTGALHTTGGRGGSGDRLQDAPRGFRWRSI